MSVFKVGKATITRVEETYQPVYRPGELFPARTDTHLKEHGHWLAPKHYDLASGKPNLTFETVWSKKIQSGQIPVTSGFIIRGYLSFARESSRFSVHC